MRVLGFLLLVLPFAAIGQTREIPKSAIDELSRDLASLQRAVLEAQSDQQSVYGKHSANMGSVAVIEPTVLRAGAADTAPVILRAAKGKTFPLVAEAPGWYAVRTEQPFQGTNTAWLRATAAISLQPETASPSAGDRIFAKMAESASRMKQSYDNNPYFTITGFTVSVVPPSVSMNFEFKK
jgi:hypothetical protein